jgi:hypothetical protein
MKTKTLTLRLSKYHADLLPELQEMTQEKTASKAIMKMIENYGDLMHNECQMKLYINTLQRRNSELLHTLQQFENVSKVVIDQLSQESLF